MATVEKEFETWFFAQLDAKLGGWMPSGENSDDERDAMLRNALKQAAAKDTATAEATLHALIGKGGDGFVTRMMLAKLLADGPNPAAARKHLEAARKHHTEAIEPLVMLANLARDEADAGGEMDMLEAALKIDGDSLEPAARLLMLGLVTRDKPRTELARRRVRGIAPLHPIALGAEAIRLVEAGDKKLARAFFDRANENLDLSRGPGDTFVVLALAAHALGDKARAKELTLAANKDPHLSPTAQKRLSVP
jgi:hypothetical protein